MSLDFGWQFTSNVTICVKTDASTARAVEALQVLKRPVAAARLLPHTYRWASLSFRLGGDASPASPDEAAICSVAPPALSLPRPPNSVLCSCAPVLLARECQP